MDVSASAARRVCALPSATDQSAAARTL